MFIDRLAGAQSVFAPAFEALYLSAFPIEERKPIPMLYQHQASGHSEIYIIRNQDNVFMGLMVTLFNHETLILEYLAIDPNYRGQNIGGWAITWLQASFPNHQIVLEIEQTLIQSPDWQIRQRRREFYERHQFYFCDQTIQYFDTRLELMSNQPIIHYQQYIQPYQSVYGQDIGQKIYYLD
ncbi:GNAT family N-acetyltransferase [Ignavigranum ruoffiae]|uniref:GNAT family N-acetyltransferase n=1 Tax=Ignavigranum ruoffiae TaxID=89093 RepID=UPI002356BD90|nr:GNAT family N-acetyltransferase [Ignavigranum ruoffiae]